MAQNNDNLSVARTLATSVKTLLGPQHSLKCCTTDDEAIICSSTAKLLQFVDIQHPAGFIINDACQGQYKKYRTNCTTLVCLAGFWGSAVQELQQQGVPVPIIVCLMDDALEVCEEVCQELSIPINETLQSHHLTYPPTKHDEEAFVDKVSNSTVDSFHGSDAIMSGKMENSDVDDGDNDNDISWYFDGQIPGVDGQIPGIDSHIPGIHGQIVGARDQILRVDDQIFGGVGLIPGVQYHITGANSNMSGAFNLEAMKNSYFAKEDWGSDILEITSFDKDVKESCVTSNNGSSRKSLLAAEYGKFEVDKGDTNVTVRNTTPLLNMTRSGVLFNVPNKPLLVEEKDNDFTVNLSSEEVHQDAKYIFKSSLESLESTSKILSSTKEDERDDDDDDDDDEFEASFQEVISNFTQNVVSDSANVDVEGKIAELTFAKEGKEIYFSGTGTKGFAHTCQKTNCAKLENTSNAKKKLVNPISLSSLGCNERSKEKEATDKFLSLLSEKLENKNKCVGRQLKMSEIFKGSRHFTNSAANGPESEMTSASQIVNQVRDSTFSEERCSKCETYSTSKTSTQSILKTGQTTKPDLAISTSRKSKVGQENTVELNQDSFVRKKTEETELIERNKELLSKLGSRLSHGKELEMKLAVEVVTSLFLSSEKSSLEDFEIHLRMIHTELVHGPPSSFSQKVDGLLLESTAMYQSVNQTAPESQLLIALVNGDVTPEFRHVGLNKEFQIHRIIKNKDDLKASLSNQEKEWYQRVTEALHNHKIGLLVVKGIVHDSIIDFCLTQSIMVLQNVSYPALQLLSFATDSTIVTYLGDLREQDVGRPVTIETWELGWTPLLVRQNKSKAGGGRTVAGIKACQYVFVKEVQGESASYKDSNSPLQTVLLCNPCKDVLCDMEERFWNSIHRLKNALSCGLALPGAGAVEVACIRRLNKLTEEQSEASRESLSPLSGWLQESLEMFRPLVYTAVAQGFRAFLGSVLHNSGKFTALCGAFAHVEKLVKSGCSLDILGSFNDENCEDNLNELQNTEEIERHNARGHVSDNPARNPSGLGSSVDPADPKRLCSDADSLVWDDYTAKKEAWRRAVGIVRILLQSDMLVQTGLGRYDNEAVLF